MLPNIDHNLYIKFKKFRPEGGYRIIKYERNPVLEFSEIVQLGYLDVNRTLRGINPEQSSLFKQAAISFIAHLLTELPKNQQDFDSLHHNYCQECLKANSRGTARIHYGQAQNFSTCH